MSTVQGDKKCPRCGGVMEYDFNCSTQEEWRNCYRCGYSQEWALDRKDGVIFTDDKNPYGIERYREGGVGIAVMFGIDGNGMSTVLMSRPRYRQVKEQIKVWKRDPYIDQSQCYIGLWDKKHKKVRVLFGKKQPSYEEFEAMYIPAEPVSVGASISVSDAEPDNDLPF